MRYVSLALRQLVLAQEQCGKKAGTYKPSVPRHSMKASKAFSRRPTHLREDLGAGRATGEGSHAHSGTALVYQLRISSHPEGSLSPSSTASTCPIWSSRRLIKARIWPTRYHTGGRQSTAIPAASTYRCEHSHMGGSSWERVVCFGIPGIQQDSGLGKNSQCQRPAFALKRDE